MALFSDYRKIYWNGFIIKDILRKFSILPLISRNIATWQTIHFQDSDTLENLAYNYYGDASMHWLIMAMNGIVDPYYDLPLRSEELTQYIDNAYNNPLGIHHYEYNGFVVESTAALKTPITNTDYEISINESKRPIRMLDKQFLRQVKDEMVALLK